MPDADFTALRDLVHGVVQVESVGEVERRHLLLRQLRLRRGTAPPVSSARTRFGDLVPERRGQAPRHIATETIDAEVLHPMDQDVRLVVEEARRVEVELHDVGPIGAVRRRQVAPLVAPEEFRDAFWSGHCRAKRDWAPSRG